MSGQATVAGLRREAREQLPGDEAGREADWLLAHALGRSLAWLFAHADELVTATETAALRELVAARARGTPIAQLTGRRGFWSFELAVSPATLIPRPETELLVEAALARLPAVGAEAVADLGTGTGAIAIALAREWPQRTVIATDASAAALEVARGNAQALGQPRIDFRHGDWCAALRDDETLAMIVSNPPYLADDDPHLTQGDLRFEPRGALASGADGLDAIRRIVAAAPTHLQAGGWLLLEHGLTQGAAVRALLHAARFTEVETLQDLEARDRVSLGRNGAPRNAASSAA